MMCIRDRDGNVISKSRNLAGIRRYVGGHTPPLIKVLDVSEIGDEEGKLCILFENGCSFETNFCHLLSAQGLCEAVAQCSRSATHRQRATRRCGLKPQSRLNRHRRRGCENNTRICARLASSVT